MTRRRALIAAALAGLAGIGAARPAKNPLADWEAGVNYRLLESPQKPSVAAGKVEVLEVFWYGCGHCYALDPLLEDWKTRMPAYVQFVRVPVIWGAPHAQHARLFYTLQELKRMDLHPKIFDALHLEGLPLADRDESQARTQHFALLNRFGITQEQFDAAYDSKTVADNVKTARTQTFMLNVEAVPTLYVNGKYATSVREAGGETQLLMLLTDLAKSERR